MITSNAYHNQSLYEQELATVFGNNWIFVGTDFDLGKNNDFITLDVGDIPVVVQNFRGVVKAFRNICLHRFNKIQTERKGNRPFFCTYHGWPYLPSGKPVLSKKFREDFADLDCLKLDEFEVDKCGIFYFLKPSVSDTGLRDYLGDYYSVLETFGEALGKEIYNEEMPHKANWKLLVENVLECYHCKTVHTETFIPMGIGILPPENFRTCLKHNDCEYPKTQSEQLDTKQKKLSFLNFRKKHHSSYHHIYIYPNLFISSTEGNLFYIGSFIPENVGKTQLNVRFFSPSLSIPEGEKVNDFLVNAYNEISVQSGLAVLSEDKVILENIQLVSSKIDREPIFGKEEFRIEHFYNAYFSDIKK